MATTKAKLGKTWILKCNLKCNLLVYVCGASDGLLICTLISENQGANLRKISGPANLDFFQFVTWIFFQVYSINLFFFLSGDLEKKSKFAGPEILLRFETDLDFQKSRCRLKGQMLHTKQLAQFCYFIETLFYFQVQLVEHFLLFL